MGLGSTTVLAWYQADLEAAYSGAKQFGYKVHTILCRQSCLPLWCIVTPAHRNDGVFAPALLKAVVALYGCGGEVVRADAAYWTKALLKLIVRLGARIAVDYNVRRKNKSLVPRAWILWWDTRMGKRATVEQYSGKWLAVFDEQIIASGDSVSEVMKKAARKIKALPLVIKVPRKDEDLYVL